MSDSRPDPEALIAQADNDLERQVWEGAIQKYHAALKITPENPRIFVGVGKAYEGKYKDDNSEVFLTMAMEQYRKSIEKDPTDEKVHDALIAAGIKSGSVDQLHDEYQSYVKKFPEEKTYQKSLKTIQKLILMGLEKKPVDPQAPPLTSFLLEKGLPLAGLFCFVGSLFLKMQTLFPISDRLIVVLLWSGGFILAVYILYKILFRSR